MNFFKYGVSLFDTRLKKFGGFNHGIAKLFCDKILYLDISLKRQCNFEIVHNDKNYYYDGYHNYISIGCVLITYGT